VRGGDSITHSQGAGAVSGTHRERAREIERESIAGREGEGREERGERRELRQKSADAEAEGVAGAYSESAHK
jgi:hypothetical protein